jgi:hypothetical protein
MRLATWTLGLLLLSSTAFAQVLTPWDNHQPAPTPSEEPPPAMPLAGYNAGNFFIKDPHDWFVLFPKGRLQIDGYFFANRGDPPPQGSNSPQDARPKDTFFIRRARAELMGTFLGHFDFSIAGEFATIPAAGTPYATNITDCFMIIDYLPFLKLQAGVYDAPFTQENRTSDKYFDFMERSLAVRAFGVPTNKETGAMLWGWMPKNTAYYSIGMFNGDGQVFKNQDNNFALIGRAFVAPLAWMPAAERPSFAWLKRIEAGASVWYQKNTNIGGNVPPSTGAAGNDIPSMTTQGGFTFFNASYNQLSYTDPIYGGTVNQRSHLVPFGNKTLWALELDVPIKWVGFRFEYVHNHTELAEYYDQPIPQSAALRRNGPIRGDGTNTANLDGFSYYVELYAWILGDVTFLEQPGVEPMPRLKKFAAAKEPRWGLMLALKYEHVDFNLNNLPVYGPNNPMTMMPNPDTAQGNYTVDAIEFGVNAWGTKHVRLTLNYVANYISGDAPTVKKNIFYNTWEHEVLMRMAIAL